MSAPDESITTLLRAMKDGDPSAPDRLLPLVYSELHRLAKSYMNRERQDHTLQPTALIAEAYIRLAGGHVDWQSREHFIAVAANVMRRILVDHARAHRAVIRGGGLKRVDLDEGIVLSKERSNELLLLDDALTKLEKLNPRQAKVVEYRFFGGLSTDQISSILGIATRSVKRDWALARIWLFKEIQKDNA